MTAYQEKITAAIQADGERVIRLAIECKPSIESIVAATRQAPGQISGVAAIALQYALRGKDNAETAANLERFSDARLISQHRGASPRPRTPEIPAAMHSPAKTGT